MTYAQFVAVLVHRVLAKHPPHVYCEECPTWKVPRDPTKADATTPPR